MPRPSLSPETIQLLGKSIGQLLHREKCITKLVKEAKQAEAEGDQLTKEAVETITLLKVTLDLLKLQNL